jgi:decaprenylphospho-beta-D-ribofuranose 2-oxidase
MNTAPLSGWGRWPVISACKVAPKNEAEAIALLSDGEKLISRGLGRSYGDPALPSAEGGRVVDSLAMSRMESFDESTGALVAEGGVSLAEIIEAFLPRGWFLPTTPGTKFVTLGGAVAADVHGKNHHVDGTFGTHVTFFDLVVPGGQVLRCSPEKNSEIFAATIGGMGLTGHILRVGLRLRRVPSAWCKVRYMKAGNLEAMVHLLSEHDASYRHTVAWIDCLESGEALGRGILMLGNEAAVDELPPEHREHPHALPRRRKLSVPFDFPGWALNSLTVKAFNAIYYGLGRDCEKLVDFEKFFYPLDAISHWNRIYGKRGFIQYQVFFPDCSAVQGLRKTLDAISRSGLSSFLAVLKRCGPANTFPLSFLDTGFTLALDMPVVPEKLDVLMPELERILAEHNGRIYFAKDACAAPDLIPKMYPRLDEFRKVQRALDPRSVLRSHLSTRLGLI